MLKLVALVFPGGGTIVRPALGFGLLFTCVRVRLLELVKLVLDPQQRRRGIGRRRDNGTVSRCRALLRRFLSTRRLLANGLLSDHELQVLRRSQRQVLLSRYKLRPEHEEPA